MRTVVLTHRSPLIADVLVRALRLHGLDARSSSTTGQLDGVIHVSDATGAGTAHIVLDGSGPVTARHDVSALIAAVAQVADGEPVCVSQPTRSSGALPRLTARELEVLGLLADGSSNAGMAAALGISPHTVRTHVQNLLAKLQVDSRLAAVTLARRHGLRPASPS